MFSWLPVFEKQCKFHHPIMNFFCVYNVFHLIFNMHELTHILHHFISICHQPMIFHQNCLHIFFIFVEIVFYNDPSSHIDIIKHFASNHIKFRKCQTQIGFCEFFIISNKFQIFKFVHRRNLFYALSADRKRNNDR